MGGAGGQGATLPTRGCKTRSAPSVTTGHPSTGHTHTHTPLAMCGLLLGCP